MYHVDLIGYNGMFDISAGLCYPMFTFHNTYKHTLCQIRTTEVITDKMSIDDKTFAMSYDAYLKNRKRNKQQNYLQ